MVNAAAGSHNKLLHVVDASSGLQLLVHTGAERSLLPPTADDHRIRQCRTRHLVTATGSPIALWGVKPLKLALGAKTFVWDFDIADVTQAIIGADFLAHHGLAVDVGRRLLVNLTTMEMIPCCFFFFAF